MEIWHTQVQVPVKTVKDDPLARIKLELWGRSCTSGTDYVKGVYSTGNSFTIRLLSLSKSSLIFLA